MAVPGIAGTEALLPPQAEMLGVEAERQQSVLDSARLVLGHTIEYAKGALANNYRKFLSGVAIVGSFGAGTVPQAAEADGFKVHSPGYLEKNCPIVVPVNVFTRGHSNDTRHGVSVHGRKIDGNTAGNSSPLAIVKYTWQIPKGDQFCGIVGVTPGIKAPQIASLKPTSPNAQTSRTGDYIDTTINSANGIHLTELSVYVRPKPKQ